MDSFNRQVLRIAVAQICQSMGWDALQKSTHDTLTDVMQRYVEEIGKVAYNYTQLCNRTKPNLDDLHLAFQDTGVVLQELENFVAQVDPLQFIHPFATYPKCQPCRLQHPSEGEIVDRAEFYSENLPSLPKTCQEPKDEKEEATSGVVDNKTASVQENEKIKSSPLTESNNVMDTSGNVLKRHHEGSVLSSRVNKRSRLDIPANLVLEKKENLENTDGESLSPSTPVSPYLPLELPKQPEEPAKPSTYFKTKTEPKNMLNVAKEMVLPLEKLTPPEKKPKSETPPGSKKAKIKKEKSMSPNVQSKLPLSSPRTDFPSPVKKLSSSKLDSPSANVKSPMKYKSPVVEKQVVKKSPMKGGENKAPSVNSKNSPAKEFPVKSFPSKKSPSVSGSKKDLSSPKTKEREFKPVKKKKTVAEKSTSENISHEPGKTAKSTSLNTTKLMIKLLPQSNVADDSPKSSTVQHKSLTTPVKGKTQGSPSSMKTAGMKVKTLDVIDGVAKSEKKLKIPSDSLEIGSIKKEHSKKKKKKKDKEKDKSIHKEKRKSEKMELPIPKIRFKLDPVGESKETKTSSSSKSSASSSHSSSKKSSMVVIETENVRSSIITETLSNTLDYDPDRAYYCPVCHKQDDGSPMVGCDGCDEWCHWTCVGLMAAPPENEKWYCPVCLLRKDKKKKGKSKKKS